ncbi:AAA+-type ATPase, partial [Coemansia asiatica]
MELFVTTFKKEPQRLRHAKRALISIEKMQAHGLVAGDIVCLRNSASKYKFSYATAWPSFVNDVEEVQISATALINCESRIGDMLHIEAAEELPIAAHVEIVLEAEFSTRAFGEACVKEALVEVGCICTGQFVDVSVNGVFRRMRVARVKLSSGESLLAENGGAIVERSETHVELRLFDQSPDERADLSRSVSFASVGGLNLEIQEIRHIVDGALNAPQDFIAYGLQPPRGVLLYGPPGTGKTLLARAAAAESAATVH